MVKFVKLLLELMKGKNIDVIYFRCNKAGGHQGQLQDICRRKEIELEYTAPGSPCQNVKVERKIAIIWKRELTKNGRCTTREENAS